jgi:hypothetical protein
MKLLILKVGFGGKSFPNFFWKGRKNIETKKGVSRTTLKFFVKPCSENIFFLFFDLKSFFVCLFCILVQRQRKEGKWN